MRFLTKENLPSYTYEDYKQWHDRWELIEGIPYAMTPLPSFKHQVISTKLARYLDTLLENCPYCLTSIAVDWKISEDTILQPDNLIVCGRNLKEILNKPYLDIPPIVVFEILSPSTEKKDRLIKFHIYAKEGVKYYVLINPESEQVEIYELVKEHYCLKASFKRKGIFLFTLPYCTIKLDFFKIFP